MKYLIIFGLLLSGCGLGYSVEQESIYECRHNFTSKWKCIEKHNFPQSDNIVAICENREECNKICAEARVK